MKHLLALLATTWLLFSTTAHANVQDEFVFSDAELDSILAPIALYPDTVLSHILIAATYPIEVVEAARWSQQQEGLSSEEILLAAELHSWDPSVQALTPFPELLNRMSEDLHWTQQIGDAFLQSETRVLDSIQKLRQRAYEEGNLQSNDYQEVEYSEGEIIIEPTRTKVVYVPYYDTRMVYGRWWWPSYPPFYWAYRPIHGHPGFRIGFAWWTPGFYLGTGVYFGGFHWHHRQVVVIRHQRPTLYSRHHVAHYQNTRRWVHNPHHRRGVHYRTPQVAERYRSNRPAHARLNVQNRASGRTYSTPQRHQASREQHDRIVRQMRDPGSYRTAKEGLHENSKKDRAQRPQSHGNQRNSSISRGDPKRTERTASGGNRSQPDRPARTSSQNSGRRLEQDRSKDPERRQYSGNAERTASSSPRNVTRNQNTESRQASSRTAKPRSQTEEWRTTSSPRQTTTSSTREYRTPKTSSNDTSKWRQSAQSNHQRTYSSGSSRASSSSAMRHSGATPKRGGSHGGSRGEPRSR